MGPSRRGAIGAQTLRGILWAYGSYAGGRALVLVATAILARLLTPDEFGLVALALAAIALLDSLRDLGVTQALVLVSDEEEDEAAATALTIGMCLSLAFAGSLGLAAGPVARLLAAPDLAPVLVVLALRFPLRALGGVHYALAQRRLDFRARTAAELVEVLVRGTVGIAAALAGAGAWSLVAGYVCGTAAMTISLWALVEWKPRLGMSRRQKRPLLRVGGLLTAVDLVSAVVFTVDNLFVGRVLGAGALGLYALAYKIPELVVQNVAVVVSQVLFPAFASLDRARLGPAYLLALRSTLLVTVPAAVLLALLAEPLLLLCFGPQWEDAAGAMRVLAAFAAFMTIGIPSGMAYKATGRPGMLLALSVPRVSLLIWSLWLFTDEGIVAVAWCQTGVAALMSAFGTLLAGRLLGTGVLAIARACLPPALAGAALAAVATPVAHAMSGGVPELVLAGTAGIAAYVVALRLAAPAVVADLLDRLRHRI